MKKVGMVFAKTIIAGFLFFLVGCQAKETQEQTLEDFPQELFVTLKSDKNQLKVNEPVKITAKVKFGDLDITEDTIVDFEIIENGEPLGSVKSEYEGDGKYSIQTMFSSVGKHQVQAHVYYEWFHEMPKLSFEVSE